MSAIREATQDDEYRWSILQDIGCVACILEGDRRGEDRRATPPDMHHLIDGYRRGHAFTVSLCPWHHRGIRPDQSKDVYETREILGPSLKHTPMSFTLRYGTDDELLALQNTLVDKWQENNVCSKH